MTSATNQSLMNISTLLTYEVRAKKQDTLWDSRLELYVRKTGDGTPVLLATISPSGVGSYNLLGSSDVTLSQDCWVEQEFHFSMKSGEFQL
jgi:hypothetical protein